MNGLEPAPLASSDHHQQPLLSLSSSSSSQGLTDAYIANGQQAKAVERLTRLRDELLSGAGATASASSSQQQPEAAAASSSDSGSGSGGSDEAAAAAASTSGASSGGAARRAPADAVSVQLLLGKAYAGWRGHDADALSAYDALIRTAPEDFRGYLAKGVFLKERGRRGDAERMFLQAKFYAPDSMKAFVQARAGENAVVDLPDNNS